MLLTPSNRLWTPPAKRIVCHRCGGRIPTRRHRHIPRPREVRPRWLPKARPEALDIGELRIQQDGSMLVTDAGLVATADECCCEDQGCCGFVPPDQIVATFADVHSNETCCAFTNTTARGDGDPIGVWFLDRVPNSCEYRAQFDPGPMVTQVWLENRHLCPDDPDYIGTDNRLSLQFLSFGDGICHASLIGTVDAPFFSASHFFSGSTTFAWGASPFPFQIDNAHLEACPLNPSGKLWAGGYVVLSL